MVLHLLPYDSRLCRVGTRLLRQACHPLQWIFFVVTVVFVVFEVVFRDRLVVPCSGFFIATVIFVVFKLVFGDRLMALEVDSLF
jgi:hypothetical protein